MSIGTSADLPTARHRLPVRGEEAFRRVTDLAASVDPQLLDNAPWAERQRFKALGSMILLIAVINFLASLGALELVLQPSKASSMTETVIGHGVCLIISAVWALIILNLYRFFVAAARPGAAGNSLDWSSVLHALPKALTALLMATLLGTTIALPVTVWIVRADIKGQLTGNQLRIAESIQEGVASRFEADLDRLYADQVADATEEERLRELIASAKAARKAGDLASERRRADAPAPDAAQEAQSADERSALSLRQAITSRAARIAEVRKQLQTAKTEALKQVETSDSLFTEAYRALEHGAGLYWAIALFMSILHAGPLLTRLLSARGPYEHLVEIQDEVVLAKHGIAREVRLLCDEDKNEHSVDEYKLAKIIAGRVIDGLTKRQRQIETRIQVKANERLARIRTPLIT